MIYSSGGSTPCSSLISSPSGFRLPASDLSKQCGYCLLSEVSVASHQESLRYLHQNISKTQNLVDSEMPKAPTAPWCWTHPWQDG